MNLNNEHACGMQAINYICAVFRAGMGIRLFIFFLLVLSAACVPDELCVGKGTNEMKIGFYDYEAGGDSPISITFDSILVSGEPENYPSFADSTASFLGLTVDPDTAWTKFIFATASRTDTLEVKYKITGSLISVQCGPELLFSELDTLYNTFDSLVIEQDIFDAEVETNLKIYY